MNKYKRLENETDNSVIRRICADKDNIGTWQDVCDLLNDILGKNFSADTYRKKFQHFSEMSSCSESYSKIAELEEKIKKEKIKVQTLNRERNNYNRNVARHELFYEQVGDLSKIIPIPTFSDIKVSSDKNIEYLMTISDIHYGAAFDCCTNVYNPEIVKDRFNSMLKKTVEFIEDKKLSELNICCLGDCLQGILRINDVRINDSSIPVALVNFVHLMASFLTELSKIVNINYYHITKSNHTQIRPLGVKSSELMDEDLEWVIGNYIKDLTLLNKRINVLLPNQEDDILFINVNGTNIATMHGHRVKDKKNILNDLRVFYDSSSIDVVLLGHYHSSLSFDVSASACGNTEVIICPSFIGSDPYSESLFKTNNGGFQILGFDDLYGHTETYRFYV